jgi:hypothetical protein
MKNIRFLLSAVTTAAVVGAVGLAFAQSTSNSPDSTNGNASPTVTAPASGGNAGTTPSSGMSNPVPAPDYRSSDPKAAPSASTNMPAERAARPDRN